MFFLSRRFLTKQPDYLFGLSGCRTPDLQLLEDPQQRQRQDDVYHRGGQQGRRLQAPSER